MKRIILLTLLCLTLALSACSQSEEDTENYSGMIGHGKALGYAYTVTKENNNFSWEIGKKEDFFNINENAANQEDLINYMNAVNDSKIALSKLIVSVTYFLIVLIPTFILYKKNRRLLSGGSVIIYLLMGVAIFIAFKSVVDLNSSLQVAKLQHLVLTNC